jgi:hypothetical protein
MDEPKGNKVKEDVHEIMKIREDGVNLVNTLRELTSIWRSVYICKSEKMVSACLLKDKINRVQR